MGGGLTFRSGPLSRGYGVIIRDSTQASIEWYRIIRDAEESYFACMQVESPADASVDALYSLAILHQVKFTKSTSMLIFITQL